MSNKKQHVVKGQFSFKSSDGQDMTMGFVLPYEVASKIACDIIGWKDQWTWTANEYEKYKEAEKQFLSELEKG